MLHQYQAQNEAMQILGTSEPEILVISRYRRPAYFYSSQPYAWCSLFCL